MFVLQDREHAHIYFIGIGGIGMSGIAEILLDQGYRVSGSDVRASGVTERLQQKGAGICIGQRAENIGADVTLVVRSSAIRENNVELVQARRLHLPVLHRSQMLAELMRGKRAVCVAGSHGKTTTSSMIALMLELNQLDPTIVLGGELAQIGSNAKLGRSDLLVAEADESDGSFLNLLPWMAVLTNVEEDHLDHYRDLAEIRQAFADFVKLTGEDGIAVLNWDCQETREMAADAPGRVISYGMAEDAQISGRNWRCADGKNQVDVYRDGLCLGTLELQIPGLHNISNALAATAAGLALGLDFSQIRAGLAAFGGARRRFQLLGAVGGVRIIDDYAHHPTEIASTIQAARSVHPDRLVVVFQPHRYSRTKFLAERFAQSFDLADEVILTDVYSAGEAREEGEESDAIAARMRRPVRLVHRETLNQFLLDFVRPGDMVLMMGAGNIWQNSLQLVEDLKQRQ